MTHRSRGFSLVELMIVVAIVGVLAALGTHGVRRYVRHARTAEALNSVGRMAKDAASAYDRGQMDPAILAVQKSAASPGYLCGSASRTVPQNVGKVQGNKYQASPIEWRHDGAKTWTGFACLKFTIAGPQHYQYDYQATPAAWQNTAAVGSRFRAIARGDLNGDGKRSTFELSGQVMQAGKARGLRVAPAMATTDPDE